MAMLKTLLALFDSATAWLAEPDIEIIDGDGHRLVLETGHGPLTVDAGRRVVERKGRTLARFSEVRHVQVSRSASEDGPDEWTVILHLGLFRNVRVGVTRDDVQASIVAARLATVIGKPVVANR